MNTRGECVEIEDFDREYGLEDLLPLPLAKALLDEMDDDISSAVIFADGRLYCGKNQVLSDYQDPIRQHKENAAMPTFFAAGSTRGLLLELVHEFETIGYLAIETKASAIADSELERFGRFTVCAFNRLTYLGYQQRMTAGLHGQVVSESYQRLKEKAAQLARSEEKYRLLAENLEAEVVRKTREIRDQQVFMLQREKLVSIGQLAAGMAHEINNPVGFIISNLTSLRSNASDVGKLIGEYHRLSEMVSAASTGPDRASQIEKQISTIDRLRAAIDIDFILEDTGSLIEETLDGTERVKNIVQSLRDFTHPSIDSAEIVDINQCLDTTLTVLSSQVPEDVAIQRDFNPVPIVQCNLREMNQVFFNLIKNAIQAVDGGGEIGIRTRAVGNAVEVCISDNGQGMDTDTINRIFEPFFTTREVGGGAGLGLTHAYNTVRSLKGNISVDSVVGDGSAVTVSLPACAKQDNQPGR